MNAYERQAEIEELQKLLKRAQQQAATNKRRTDDLVEAVYRAAYEAAKDQNISNAVIHRVINKSGFKISYTAIARLRKEIAGT